MTDEMVCACLDAMAKRPVKTAKSAKPHKARTVAKSRKPPASAGAKTIDTLNVNAPGKTYKRDAVKYQAARKAFLALMPTKAPGLNQTEMFAAMRKALPEFGSTSGWWMKTVQLDAEARGEVVRDGGKPLRWRKVK
jgi:hypothetical protein